MGQIYDNILKIASLRIKMLQFTYNKKPGTRFFDERPIIKYNVCDNLLNLYYQILACAPDCLRIGDAQDELLVGIGLQCV